MNVVKDKGVLIFSHDDRGMAKYDLKDGSMFRNRSGKEYKAKNLALFFQGYDVDKVFSNLNDEKFIDFMKYVRRKESTCYSVGTFLYRMGKYIKAESFHKLGINLSDRVHIKNVDMKLIPKDIIRILVEICKDKNLKIKEDFFRIVNSENKDLYLNMVRYSYLKYDISNTINLLNYGKLNFDNMAEFINEYNYEYKSLMDYIVYINEIEGLGMSFCNSYLKDYYSQNLAMARNKKSIEKYPKFLKSRHDITSKHYQLFKEIYSEDIFKSRYKSVNFEYKGKDKFVVINPINTDDMKDEGRELSHCVKSYINKIIDGKTIVVFIRNKKEISERLLTMEIQNDEIVQIKGLLNRSPNQIEIDFIKKYAKIKELKINKYIGVEQWIYY